MSAATPTLVAVDLRKHAARVERLGRQFSIGTLEQYIRRIIRADEKRLRRIEQVEEQLAVERDLVRSADNAQQTIWKRVEKVEQECDGVWETLRGAHAHTKALEAYTRELVAGLERAFVCIENIETNKPLAMALNTLLERKGELGL